MHTRGPDTHDNDSDSDDSASVKFLTSDTTNEAHDDTEQTHRFPLSRCTPPDLLGNNC